MGAWMRNSILMASSTSKTSPAADHEAGDVLQKEDRDAALLAKLNEMRALLRALTKEHVVVA
jgi:hypothetical protein